MLRIIARGLSWLSDFATDADHWLHSCQTWRGIREDTAAVRRALLDSFNPRAVGWLDFPPSVGMPRIDTSDRPFGLPPDVPIREVDRLEPLPHDVLYRISTGGRP